MHPVFLCKKIESHFMSEVLFPSDMLLKPTDAVFDDDVLGVKVTDEYLDLPSLSLQELPPVMPQTLCNKKCFKYTVKAIISSRQ